MKDDQRPQGDLVEIFRANTQVEAHSLVIFLAGRGIRAVVQSDSYQAPVSIVAIEYAIQSGVYVNEEDVKEAQAALIEFKSLTRPSEQIQSDPQDQFHEPHIAWREWPRCPACSCRRITECPDCGEAGDDFSLAEYQEEEAPLEPTRPKKPLADDEEDEPLDRDEEDEGPAIQGQRPFLDCPRCGEVFRPKFYRRCAQCTHVFPDGKSPPPVEKPKQFRWGPILMLGGVILLVVALAVAFQIRMQFQD